MATSYWKKMSPEQKAKQLERSKIWRHKKRAKELGLTLEEYQAQKGTKSIRTQSPSAKVKPIDLTNHPQTKMIQSQMFPWITFKMEKYDYGTHTGYQVVEKVIDKSLMTD